MGMEYMGADKHKAYLFAYKQDKLVAGPNIEITPNEDGKTATISASGGEGTVTDVLVDGVSVVNQDGEAEFSTMTGATSQMAGKGGLVPAPAITDKDKFFKGDGTWGEAGGGNVDDVVMNGQSIVDANKVASFNNYVELTQSEYDALPDSKLTDGILYCIKDTGIVEGEKFAPMIYSLEEREIGVWTDGKPLYQKSFALTAPSTSASTNLFDTTDLNIDLLIKLDGIIWIQANTTHTGGNSFILWERHSVSDGNKIATQITNSAYQGGRMYVTLFYTKTTDVPGSGKWTTQGVPAVHYDGNEKVIGTWFGRTLYEKTIWYESPNNQADSKTIIDSTLKNGLNCYIVHIEGIQMNGYLNQTYTTTNEYSDAEPLSQSKLHLSYYNPSELNDSGWINCDRDGIRFTKNMATSKANSLIITVRYIKKESASN